ncbi:MAG: CDP-alcohol phosphatidyltransferase [Deferribacteres bacterium]|nr:CDP-alcohol phosphatidyltransferase [candidate division KSB1 bacterium]MCB9508694.1 CDP-alcohol phosphatidyltransferase [Deferribacteres bacterium]
MEAESKEKKDRIRSNVLRDAEQATIAFLCRHMPQWVTPNKLTAVGFVGSLLVFTGLWFGRENRWYLLMSIAGLAINWFGDSLDGRLAYYRKTPRKWFGFSLDVNVDWTATCLIALGFYFYLPDFKFIALIFVVAYGGSMIISLLRYRVTNAYAIDRFALGPTEMRIILSVFLLVEVFQAGVLLIFAFAGSVLLIIINAVESRTLLREADLRDVAEKKAKLAE